MAKIQIINPIKFPYWDELLLTNPESDIYHTSAWARVLNETYRYRPLYFTIIEDGHLTGLVPIMEIKSILTGRRGVSLPFSDECSPVVSDANMFELLFRKILEYAKRAGWNHVELKGGQKQLSQHPASNVFAIHTLNLDTNIDDLFGFTALESLIECACFRGQAYDVEKRHCDGRCRCRT